MSKELIYGSVACYTMVAFVLCITCASWMVNQNNSESWRHTIMGLGSSDTAAIYILQRSWEVKPFVDIVVTNERNCPYSHPEDVIFEIWLGTKGMCDCLERAADRLYELDTMCKRGKN